MTVVTFFREGSELLGFSAEGHTGNAAQGEDIVCAAVSAAVGLAECELTDVLRLPAEVIINEDRALVSVKFNKPAQAAQPILTALRLYLGQVSGEYPRFLKIMEV